MVIYYIFIIFGIFVAASMLKSKKKKKAKTKKKQKQNSKNWHFPLFPPTLYFLKPKKKKNVRNQSTDQFCLCSILKPFHFKALWVL